MKLDSDELKSKYIDIVFLDILIRLSLAIEFDNHIYFTKIQQELEETIKLTDHNVLMRASCYQLLWKLQSRDRDGDQEVIVVDEEKADMLQEELKQMNFDHMADTFMSSLYLKEGGKSEVTIEVIASDPYIWILPKLEKISDYRYVQIYCEKNKIYR